MSDLRYANAPAFDAAKAAESFSSAKATNDMRGAAAPIESDTGSTGKIIAALAIGAVVVGLGAYTYATGMWTAPQQNERVASNDLPAPPALPQQPAMTPTTAPPDVTPPVLDTPVQKAPEAPQIKTARVISSKPVSKPAAENVPKSQTQMTTPVPPAMDSSNIPSSTLPPQSALTPAPSATDQTETQTAPDTTPEQTPQQPQ